MFSTDLLFLVLCLGMAGVVVALGVPLFNGWVPPNGIYGFRNATTTSDPLAWYPANQVSGFWLIVTGIVMAGVYGGMYAAGIPFGFCLFFTLATLMTGIVVMAVQSDAAARLRAVPAVRLQFRLLAIFVAMTLVAIGCAIARLPGTWVFKTGLLWAYAICVIGILVRNYKPKAPNQV